MAQMLPGFNVIGPTKNFSVYKMRGTDKTVVRSKGGASKEKIKHAPSFAPTRRANKEFGGRSKAAKRIKNAMGPLDALADYNFLGPLNSLLRPIQLLDTVSENGKRAVCLSRQPYLLEGFSLNRGTTIDSIVRTPFAYTLSREGLTATVAIPALLPGINFHVPGNKSFFSFIMILGVAPDLFLDGVNYEADSSYGQLNPTGAISEWYPVNGATPALTLAATLRTAPVNTAFSLVLSIGIRFGMVGQDGTVQQVKQAGAARVLAVG